DGIQLSNQSVSVCRQARAISCCAFGSKIEGAIGFHLDMTIETEIQDSSLDRLPPQSLDSEQAVIGGLLVSGDAITRVIDLLEPEHFYRKAHTVIYAAMLDLFDKNEPIDIVTVSQYLKDEGKLENVGGRQYITDLSLSVATTANLEYYARIVQE